MATYVRLPERVKQAEQLAEQNGGVLPRPSALRTLNPQLMQAIFRKPEAFAHIPRESSSHKTDDEWVKIAEEIARRNGGQLPAHKDLQVDNPALASCIYRKPQIFAHIPRAKWTNAKAARIAKYVAEAEKLAAEDGGILFLSREFQTKHNALTCAIRANPEAFAHIPRQRRETKTLEEHVALAKELVAARGALPPVSRLKRDYPALRTMMQNHPEAFKDMKVQSLITSTEQYVQLAKELCDQNGGVLPAGSWLLKNDYRNLESAIYRKPEFFKGIKQEVRDARGKLVRIKIIGE